MMVAPGDTDLATAQKIASTFCPPKEKKRTSTISDALFLKIRAGVERMIRSGDWSKAGPRDFVALYAMLHVKVYGVEPEELTSAARVHATFMAANLFKRSFDQVSSEMAEFLRWVWIREEGREKWRKSQDISGGRISWRLQFNGALVTDWRIERRRHLTV